MIVAHAWVGPYDGGWHCYQCGTTVTLPTGQEPVVAGCPATTDDLIVKFRQQPGGWSRRSWAALVEMLQQERDEARAEVEAGDRRWSLAADECDRLRSERKRLRALLWEARPCRCDDLHHPKRDRHGIGDPCPVLARIDAALEERDG